MHLDVRITETRNRNDILGRKHKRDHLGNKIHMGDNIKVVLEEEL
jgi:hypothetical protein